MKNYRLISDVDSAIRDTTEEAIVFLSENIGGGGNVVERLRWL